MATEPQTVAPTPAREWKGKIEAVGKPLPLPSKNVALVRQIAPTAFLEAGMIPDPLKPMIQEAIGEKKGLPPKKMKEIANDPKMLSHAMEMFDRALCYVVIEPEVSMPPTCTECGEYANKPQHQRGDGFDHKYSEGTRDPDILYVDTIDLTDKQFVFQWAMGGVSNLKSFRNELAATMEPLSE